MTSPAGDDLAPLFAGPPLGPAATMTYRTGSVLSWDTLTGANTVRVDNTVMTNLPMLNSSEVRTMVVGANVAILCARYPSGSSTFAIMGRIVRPETDEMTAVISSLSAGSFQVSHVPEYDETDQWGPGDLEHYGPECIVDVGSSGRILVLYGMVTSTVGGSIGVEGGGRMLLELSGANNVPASLGAADEIGLYCNALNGDPDGYISINLSGSFLYEGLDPGLTRVTAKYSFNVGGDGFPTEFGNRYIITVTL